ncbi:MAG: hypothetical protein Kow0025_15690 [Thermodesulfovibrionales bacterium]
MKRTLALILAAAATLLMAGAASSAEIKVIAEDELGKYLADSNGMTLYYYKKDTPGRSVCASRCLDAWPLFYDKELTTPLGIDPSDFGTITRTDGRKQSTFRDYPLYYYSGDEMAGERNGHNVGNVWSVVNPDKFRK